ncbi:MAG: nitroreductase family protein [Anaerolineae bacterium]
MDFFDVVEARQSVRAFMPQPIEPEKVQQILAAIDRAPSAGNLQGYEVYLVTRRQALEALARATNGQDFIAQAPLALVFCANPARSSPKYGQRGATLYCVQDATIACTFAQLAITAIGLASVWVGSFDEDSVRAAIGVGAELRPVAFLPIGYPAEAPERRSRRVLADLVHLLE